MTWRFSPIVASALAAGVAGVTVALMVLGRAARDVDGRLEFEDVRLPEAGSAIDEPCDRAGHTAVVVYHPAGEDCPPLSSGSCPELTHWRSAVRGADLDFPALRALISSDAGLSESRPGISERVASLRADRGAPWGHVRKVLEAFMEAGMYKVQFAARRPGARENSGALQAWIHREGPRGIPSRQDDPRILISTDASGAVRRSFMGRSARDDAGLAADLREFRTSRMKPVSEDSWVVIDAAAAVPFGHVVAAIDVARREGIEEFRYEPAR